MDFPKGLLIYFIFFNLSTSICFGQSQVVVDGMVWLLDDETRQMEFIGLNQSLKGSEIRKNLCIAEASFYKISGFLFPTEYSLDDSIVSFKLQQDSISAMLEIRFLRIEDLVMHYHLNSVLLDEILPDHETSGYYELDDGNMTIGQGKIWERSIAGRRNSVIVYIRFDSSPNHSEFNPEWLRGSSALILRRYKI
jgi:hypothetical protein